MKVTIAFADEHAEFEVEPDRVLRNWHGPNDLTRDELRRRLRDALEESLDYPPLRQVVVPGDRVAIAFDADLPEPGPILEAVCEVLQASGVEPADIQVLGPRGGAWMEAVPHGVSALISDPADQAQMAYLASTASGRRVYLDRRLIDADVVLPIGHLGFHPTLGYSGPWSAIYPNLSNTETQKSHQGEAGSSLDESADVSWLLGSQFQVGVVPGARGVAAVLAGLASAVRAAGVRAVEEHWDCPLDDQAAVVVAGIGAPDQPVGWEEVAAGLAHAAEAVRAGGKIVLLSRASGPLGPALQRLAALNDPREGPAGLRGADGEPDFRAARRLARVLAHADVYLLSALDQDAVEDLAMIPITRPDQARRMVAEADSCIFLGRAELTRVTLSTDAP